MIAERGGELDAVVVGAGPAGLAVGACLRRSQVSFEILERGTVVGSAWHRHYRRLHLHTPKAHSALPYMAFPRAYPTYPSRQQVVDYLERYARQFDLRPRFGDAVRRIERHGGEWQVRTGNDTYVARHVIVATGFNGTPYVPHWPGQHDFAGRVLHSSEYRDGESFRGQRVLVVGFGNSGGEIAVDLQEHDAEASLAVRSRVNLIPRDVLGIPIVNIVIWSNLLPLAVVDVVGKVIARLAFGRLDRYGLQRRLDGPARQIAGNARVPLIDVGTVRLIKQGAVQVRSGIRRFTETGVVFDDGHEERFDAVVLATGFRPHLDFLAGDAARYRDATAIPRWGREAAVPGLFFCGFHVALPGMFRQIALEAKRIARRIAQRPSPHTS